MASRRGIQIVVLGVGGAGCNTITRLYDIGLSQDAKLVAVHAEAPHLERTLADVKLLVGERLTRGRGTGGDYAIGEQCITEDIDKIFKAVGVPDCLIVTGGLGGGLGSGGMPVILDYYKRKYPQTLRIAVVSYPFRFEGENRHENAAEGLRSLLENADLTILNLNDMLLERAGEIAAEASFKLLDVNLANTVRELVFIAKKGGMIGISYADFVETIKGGGLGMAGHGIGKSLREALEAAFSNVFLDGSGTDDSVALAYATAPPGTSLREMSDVPRWIMDKYRVLKLYWGHRTERVEECKVMFIISNVHSETVESILGG